MKTKFKFPVTMKVTEEQYKEDLEESLGKLGYIDSVRPDGVDFTHNYLILSNCYGNTDSTENLGRLGIEDKSNEGSYFIDRYNPELFLALASSTKGKEYIKGEWMYCKKDTYNHTKGLLYIVTVSGDNNSFRIGYNGSEKGAFHVNELKDYRSHFRRAKKKEIISHFTKENFVLPDKWFIKVENVSDIEEYLIEKYGKLHSYFDIEDEDGLYLYSDEETDFAKPSYVSCCKLPKKYGYSEITFEQFEKYVLNNNKKEMKEESVFPQMLSEDNARRIIKMVCSGWSEKLAKKWGKDLILNREVRVTQKDYDLAVIECDSKQMDVINEIVGIEKEEFYMIGTRIRIFENEYILAKNNLAEENGFSLINVKTGMNWADSIDVIRDKDNNMINEEELNELLDGAKDFEIIDRK